MAATPLFSFYEFFAGAGMARLGLGEGWACAFANDFDGLKTATYRANFPAEDLVQGDVWALSTADLAGAADLAWASSPCQDLSLAGARAGLSGGRSSAFWGFLNLVEGLAAEDRAPRLLVIENVTGLLTSGGGRDFAALATALAQAGYRPGAIELDAALWLPQSRPRVFVVATREAPPPGLTRAGPAAPFHGRATVQAFAGLTPEVQAQWVWWAPAVPPVRNADLSSLLEDDAAVAWFTPARTARLLELMSPLHRARLETAAAAGDRRIGAVYRRVRVEQGRKVQRAEVRFDGLAGCLRTPKGGSSRQIVVVAEQGRTRARWLTPREAARLMGLPDSFVLPSAETAALKVLGDGVAAPVVRALAAGLLEPLLSARVPVVADSPRRLAWT
jgi:DNA (cytosine-5)-methyltransferase 1